MARKKPNAVKSEAYECGVEPTSDVSGRFPVRFYLIAMLFVIFDVEAASFYPWAVQMHVLRVFGLAEMLIFVIVLAIAFEAARRLAAPVPVHGCIVVATAVTLNQSGTVKGQLITAAALGGRVKDAQPGWPGPAAAVATWSGVL